MLERKEKLEFRSTKGDVAAPPPMTVEQRATAAMKAPSSTVAPLMKRKIGVLTKRIMHGNKSYVPNFDSMHGPIKIQQKSAAKEQTFHLTPKYREWAQEMHYTPEHRRIKVKEAEMDRHESAKK